MLDRFVSNIPAFDVGNGPRTASVGVILQEADLRARRSRGNDFHPHPAPCDTRSPRRAVGAAYNPPPRIRSKPSPYRPTDRNKPAPPYEAALAVPARHLLPA